MKRFILLVCKNLIFWNKKISDTFLEKLAIFAKRFISDMFERYFEYTHHSFKG